jgi:hypothetical protein
MASYCCVLTEFYKHFFPFRACYIIPYHFRFNHFKMFCKTLLRPSRRQHCTRATDWRTVVSMTTGHNCTALHWFDGASRSYFTTDGQSVSQSVSMSWYGASLWDLRPDITSCRNVAVRNLRSCIYWAPSLTRGRVCNLQCNHSMVRVAQNPKPYFTVSSETPPTCRVRFPYLYPQGTGWPSYTPRHWVLFTSSLTTRAVCTAQVIGQWSSTCGTRRHVRGM